MIRSVEIKGLRGIRMGSLTDFTPLVVLVGPNGSGKSTILDALLIAANPRPPEGIGQAVERREGLSGAARWLLWKAGKEGPAEIAVRTDSEVRSCTFSVAGSSEDRTTITGNVRDQNNAGKTSASSEIITVFEAGKRPGPSGFFKPLEDVPELRFIDPSAGSMRAPLHRLYTRVVEEGLHKGALESIRSLIPGIEEIQILADGGTPVVYLIFNGYAIPAALTGDGIRLLLHLTFELATRPGGLVLMEEPETHMHPGAIRECARAILAAVRRKVQIVLSTHSLELIDSLLAESTDADVAHLSLYRLELQADIPKLPPPEGGPGPGSREIVAKAGILKSSRLAGPEVAFARTEIQDDLR